MRRRMLVVLCVGGLLGAGALALESSATGASRSRNGPLFAVLLGRNEVDLNGHKGAGDPNARGSASAIVDGGQLCFAMTVKNLDQPIAAHIHKAKRGKNGAIVIPLTAPTSGDPGASSGCVDAPPAVTRAILAHPGRYYWNIHSQAFPGGAVRGQLFTRTH